MMPFHVVDAFHQCQPVGEIVERHTVAEYGAGNPVQVESVPRVVLGAHADQLDVRRLVDVHTHPRVPDDQISQFYPYRLVQVDTVYLLPRHLSVEHRSSRSVVGASQEDHRVGSVARVQITDQNVTVQIVLTGINIDDIPRLQVVGIQNLLDG